jgi:hypothetical protein
MRALRPELLRRRHAGPRQGSAGSRRAGVRRPRLVRSGASGRCLPGCARYQIGRGPLVSPRGRRLHRPGHPRAGPRDADVAGRATASLGHLTAASRRERAARRTHLGRVLARSLPSQPRCRAGYAYATHSAGSPRAAGRLHRPDDAQAARREANVRRRALLSWGVGLLVRPERNHGARAGAAIGFGPVA